MAEYKSYTTEGINPASVGIDKMNSREIVGIINNEDKTVALAVERELDNIARAVDLIVERMENGGHLVYIGAGTSGRLAILDAAECPPTYGVSPDVVRGIIAGGIGAVVHSSEDAEDSAEAAVSDLKNDGFSSKDVLFGVSASGSAAYVVGALEYAKTLGAATVALSCREGSAISKVADVAISPVVGAEVISGSTRMKAGTAQKMVLTMTSTAVMIRLGRVHGNLMAYMKPTNKKLRDRAIRIIVEDTKASPEEAENALAQSGGMLNEAINLILSTRKVK